MKSKDVLLVLTDLWADWEAAYAIAEINSSEKYTVKTIAIDNKPKQSIGGIKAEVDLLIGEYFDFSHCALIILPGGLRWKENDYHQIIDFVKRGYEMDVPIAAICGATQFLAKNGFLDEVYHTGDTFDYFKVLQGYKGHDKFQTKQVVMDKNIITANETAAVEFAAQIFSLLKIDNNSEIDKWKNYYQCGLF